MSLKRRLGEGDEVPSIAAAAVTVTLSSEGSKAAPSYSGYSADAPPQSAAQAAQEAEPEVQGSSAAPYFENALRQVMQGAHPQPRALSPHSSKISG